MSLSRRNILGAMAAVPMVAHASQVFAQAQPTPVTPAPAAARKRLIGLPSRQFQHQPSIEKCIELARRAGFDTIEWNVRDGAHVLPVNAERDLPRAVDLTRKAGLEVEMTCTSIQDAQTPYAETVLKAMKATGIRHYRSSNYFRYDYTKPIQAQIDALRTRFASIAELNAKYNTIICYHTHSGAGNIGGPVWDMWQVMKDFDPNLVAFNYDTAHTTVCGGPAWRQAALEAARSISAVALKDAEWIEARTPTAPRGVRSEMSVVGEGIVDFKSRFELLRDIGFNGPLNIHYEHHGLLFGDIGAANSKLNMTEEAFIGLLKADLDYMRAAMRSAGFST